MPERWVIAIGYWDAVPASSKSTNIKHGGSEAEEGKECEVQIAAGCMNGCIMLYAVCCTRSADATCRVQFAIKTSDPERARLVGDQELSVMRASR